MAIIALKAWYIDKYEPVTELEKRPQDLRLSKNSLLKSALRADFLEDSQEIKNSTWFKRYLAGQAIEFYIEGSGGYVISNIDLISHEIYFTKQDVLAQLEPTIFLSCQNGDSESSESLQTILEEAVAQLNQKSRLPLKLETSLQSKNAPLRLSNSIARKIRKSLLFVADTTPITEISRSETTQFIPSPTVCIELGCALQTKRVEQILLVQIQPETNLGTQAFDLPTHQQLSCSTVDELLMTLPSVLEALLQRYNLFS
ncbi:hypothetical protein [Merismopedia glauca]|uniref:Uncharacterized protein n=1 Tax=Merismopedia glauca CCAP 1448/3 TaxID=1296344 RepID=A0A2T1C0L3_9CYAN|nr:hypothetical protein [Merismopedia glauca]PSB01782.1 hypothetical protein C7B64_16460 [Merismopedia glauca CCAP 1448/3]